MNLINYIDAVLSDLGWNPYLVIKGSDIFNLIIRCSIKFMNIKWSRWIKWQTWFAFITCFKVFTKIAAVNCFGKDPCAGCFTYSSWSAKKISLCKMVVLNSTFQRICNGILANYHIKTGRPVFPGWNDEVFHKSGILVFQKSWNTNIVKKPSW